MKTASVTTKTKTATGGVQVAYVSPAARQKQLSAACQRFARRHGYYASTVRSCTALMAEAMREAGIR